MDDQLLLFALFGGLHVIGMCFAAMLLLPCLKDESVPPWAQRPGEDDDGGGGNDRLGPDAPQPDPRPGGLPLPDAVPARVRLRGPGRLADLTPPAERRPSHPPVPSPTPARRERIADR